MEGDRDSRLLVCYLGAVPSDKFEDILADYVRNFDDGPLKKPTPRGYSVFYQRSEETAIDGKKYPRNVAYIHTKDPRFAYRMCGCKDDGSEEYLGGELEHLDNVIDFGIFEELYGLSKDDLANCDVTPMPNISTRRRAFPPNPRTLKISEDERHLYPPTSSARTTGEIEFVFKPARLTTSIGSRTGNTVRYSGKLTSAVVASFNSDSAYHPVIDEKAHTVAFRHAIDAYRVVTIFGKCGTATFADDGRMKTGGSKPAGGQGYHSNHSKNDGYGSSKPKYGGAGKRSTVSTR